MTQQIADIFDRYFRSGTMRMPRSDAYRDGARAGIRSRVEGGHNDPPYLAGTAEMDAWLAGFDEGRKIAKWELAQEPTQ